MAISGNHLDSVFFFFFFFFFFLEMDDPGRTRMIPWAVRGTGGLGFSRPQVYLMHYRTRYFLSVPTAQSQLLSAADTAAAAAATSLAPCAGSAQVMDRYINNTEVNPPHLSLITHATSPPWVLWAAIPSFGALDIFLKSPVLNLGYLSWLIFACLGDSDVCWVGGAFG